MADELTYEADVRCAACNGRNKVESCHLGKLTHCKHCKAVFLASEEAPRQKLSDYVAKHGPQQRRWPAWQFRAASALEEIAWVARFVKLIIQAILLFGGLLFLLWILLLFTGGKR